MCGKVNNTLHWPYEAIGSSMGFHRLETQVVDTAFGSCLFHNTNTNWDF